MHPVLGSRARLGTYLLAWVPGMALLASQFLAGGWALRDALALAVPACLLASALFLSSWHLCRVAPLRPDRSLRLLGTWAAASAVGTVPGRLLGKYPSRVLILALGSVGISTLTLR